MPTYQDTDRLTISPKKDMKESPKEIRQLRHKRIVDYKATDNIEIPLICLNYPIPQRTYGLIYILCEETYTMHQIKTIIARQYQVYHDIIRLFNKGFEMPDEVTVSTGYSKGEILYFTINLPQIHIINIKIDFVYEKYYSL